MMGRASGTMMLRKVRKSLAPSMRAASISSGGIVVRKNVIVISRLKGPMPVGRIMAQRVLSKPRSRTTM